MKRVVILCNGEFPRKDYPLYLLESAEAVVCCDGAAVKYLRKFGEKRLPEVVIGDMDSLPKRLQEKLAPIVVPVEEQDYNDMTKAMRYVLEHHPDVTDIQLAGKKRMDIKAFLLGFREPETYTTSKGTSKDEILKTKPQEEE